jgi:hypothetical protein
VRPPLKVVTKIDVEFMDIVLLYFSRSFTYIHGCASDFPHPSDRENLHEAPRKPGSCVGRRANRLRNNSVPVNSTLSSVRNVHNRRHRQRGITPGWKGDGQPRAGPTLSYTKLFPAFFPLKSISKEQKTLSMSLKAMFIILRVYKFSGEYN